MRPISPGEVLQEEFLIPCSTSMEEFTNISMEQFANNAGLSLSELRSIIRGEKNLDEEIANKFAKSLGTTAEFWMNLERNYRQALER